MTDTEQRDWLAGRWIAVRPRGYRNWTVRRQERGVVQTRKFFFPSQESAMKYANKLNAMGGR